MGLDELKGDSKRRWTEFWGKNFLGKITFVVGVAMALFHLYFSSIGLVTTIGVRSGHLIFAMCLIFLIYPLNRKGIIKNKILAGASRGLDLLCAGMATVAGMYIIMIYPEMNYHLGNLTIYDKVFGAIIILLTLEITRRTIGYSLTIIAVIFLLYAYFGPYMPGMLAHRGVNMERIISQMYCTLEGIYGIPIGVMATYVYLFVLFGAFLERSGATEFFIKLSYVLTGKYAGGPAKTAVFASSLMGSVSGSAIANAVTTGAITIPLMKKVGYRPETAAGIEAAASTGGQMMPPLMGAGAFIMSEYTGIPYTHIVKISIIPAILYYMTVWLFVHNEAIKLGLKGLSKAELPQMGETLKEGFHCLFPLALLIVLLVAGYSPTLAATASTAAVLVVGWCRKASRIGFMGILETLAKASRMALSVSAACACAGLIVGVVGLTGLGLKFSGMVLEIAGSNLFMALVLVLFASLVLGMGLPVTASYIMLATLAAPVLSELGVPMVAAHLIIFWYSQSANVTPPVCLAAYAAAGIAGADSMKTGIEGVKLAKGLFLIPLLFAYRPEILFTSGIGDALLITLFGVVGLVAGVAALDGFLIRPLNLILRIMMLVAAVGIFWPGRIYSIAGTIILLVILIYQIYHKMSIKKATADLTKMET